MRRSSLLHRRQCGKARRFGTQGPRPHAHRLKSGLARGNDFLRSKPALGADQQFHAFRRRQIGERLLGTTLSCSYTDGYWAGTLSYFNTASKFPVLRPNDIHVPWFQ